MGPRLGALLFLQAPLPKPLGGNKAITNAMAEITPEAAAAIAAAATITTAATMSRLRARASTAHIPSPEKSNPNA